MNLLCIFFIYVYSDSLNILDFLKLDFNNSLSEHYHLIKISLKKYTLHEKSI
ncbi:hypothetical protein CAL7102_06453 [Dulcicalothrix desertica PCC 7102]|nr:hypothetical protein CAL7102_06453 [Dulcicalothrix desertica PCC 7102]